MNFLQQFREECEKTLIAALEKTYPDWVSKVPRLTVPPSLEFGELTSSIAHEIAREKRLSPQQIAQRIRDAATVEGKSFVSSVDSVAGYVNFKLNYSIAGQLILDSVLREGAGFGMEKAEPPLRVSVEHTSVNPSGPITMGHARNSILGDALARLLKARGNTVNRRFYIDDLGRQVSILACGYKLIGQPEPQGKPDHWFGRLYACTNCAVQIETAKRNLALKDLPVDKKDKVQRDLDEWVGIAAELEATDKELLAKVMEAVKADAEPNQSVQDLGKLYEQQDGQTVALVRKISQFCLDGIKNSLADIGILFDTWDWESQILWDGHVEQALARIRQLPFVKRDGASISLGVNAIADAYSLRKELNLSESYEIPALTLVRSDGTTLYPTRDIAYSILKSLGSDKVINVIAMDQSLPQLQIRLALFAIGEQEAARNQIHYSYGLVEMPGVKMSKRRAHYIALDEVVGQAKMRVQQAMTQRKSEFTDAEYEQTVRNIALGAIRFTMLSISSTKNLTFTWDRVLSLERNSAPFINYAYTRAGSILRKLGQLPTKADISLLTDPLEHLLLFKIGQMPDVFCEAADQLKPEELAGYANSLAEKFHEYYEKVDVIHADEQVKNARAMLVKAIQIALQNSMQLLGVELSERM